MADKHPDTQKPPAYRWMKYVVGLGAGVAGLRLAAGDGAVCNMLANERWPGADPRDAIVAASNCDNAPVFYFGLAAIAGYMACGILADHMRRPIPGIFVGLAAGTLAGGAGAFGHFLALYGWP